MACKHSIAVSGQLMYKKQLNSGSRLPNRLISQFNMNKKLNQTISGEWWSKQFIPLHVLHCFLTKVAVKEVRCNIKKYYQHQYF